MGDRNIKRNCVEIFKLPGGLAFFQLERGGITEGEVAEGGEDRGVAEILQDRGR